MYAYTYLNTRMIFENTYIYLHTSRYKTLCRIIVFL